MQRERTLTSFEMTMHNCLLYDASSYQSLQRLLLGRLKSVLGCREMTEDQKKEAVKLLIDSIGNLVEVSRLILQTARFK